MVFFDLCRRNFVKFCGEMVIHCKHLPKLKGIFHYNYQLCNQEQGKFPLFVFCNAVIVSFIVTQFRERLTICITSCVYKNRGNFPCSSPITYNQDLQYVTNCANKNRGNFPCLSPCNQVIASANENMGHFACSSPVT